MKKGDKVYVEELRQYGTISKIGPDGIPLEVSVKTVNEEGIPIEKVIDVVGLTVSVLGWLEKILLAVRDLIRKWKGK